jgi:NAD+ synthase
MRNKMELVEKISSWIRQAVAQAKAEGVVVGLSGGIDSSVVACLAKKALGERVLGVIMPCHSGAIDEDYARLIARRLKIKIECVSLNSIYDNLLRALPGGKKMALANLKPRLRMLILYYFANNLNYLVAGTGNKSEVLIGYFTKYGDGGCDILPLGDLLKRGVRELAKELRVPQKIIERAPSAGLWEKQTDEGEIGITYEELDETIMAIESNQKSSVSPEVLARVEELMRESVHKRSLALMFRKS